MKNSTEITSPSSPTPFRRLTNTQCQRLFEACLEILERTGIRLYDQEALDLLKNAGVSAFDGNRVRIPSKMVEKALSTAPRKVTLHNRYGEPTMPVEGYCNFYGPGSDCLNIIDHRTWERRQPVLQDVIEAATVADALSNIDFAMSLFVPMDLSPETAERYQMEAMLTHTTKPIFFVTSDFSGCADAVEMAAIVAGSEVALIEKPNVACYINVTTGLIHNKEALQKLLYLSEKGIPAAYVPSTQGGVTAPVTPISAMALSQAGALAGLVLAQLKKEGAPLIMPGWGGSALDMRTTVMPYADPDKRLLAQDFVHFLGLPMFSLAGCSDSKMVDQQAGLEAALTLMTDTVRGSQIIHDLGYLESGLTGSLAQLVICDEILSWLQHFVHGVEINEETLALDLIDEVGPDGHFLEADHTYQHFRERFYPNLLDRNNYSDWMDQGGKSLAERAAERVESILVEHKPEQLPDDLAQGIHSVVLRAQEKSSLF